MLFEFYFAENNSVVVKTHLITDKTQLDKLITDTERVITDIRI